MTHPLATRTDRHGRESQLRTARIEQRMLRAVAVVCTAIVGGILVGGALTGGALATPSIDGATTATAAEIVPATATTHATAGTCAGVIVVVDFTDLGGQIEVGCAEGDQPTGRDALLAAEFIATDSQPGFLCAINSTPNPCPETFQGSFWSYWHSSAFGEWVSYQVGADSSRPISGEIEGWRYNDGATPPGITPADAAGALPAPLHDDSDQQVTNAPSDLETQSASQNMVLLGSTLGFLTLVAALILFFVVRRRRRTEAQRGTSTHDGESDGPESDHTGARD